MQRKSDPRATCRLNQRDRGYYLASGNTHDVGKTVRQRKYYKGHDDTLSEREQCGWGNRDKKV